MLATRAFTAVRPARPAAAPARRAVSVVCMAKPTKTKDFEGLSNEELVKKVGDLKRALASTKWVQRTGGVEEVKPGENMPQPDREKAPKTHLNSHLRRQVAQCMTLIRQRQIKDGINRKDARTMEKQASLAAKMPAI